MSTQSRDRFLLILGWVATATAICMYVSHIDPIIKNLNGDKQGWVVPLATAVNCTLWVSYGLLKEKKDWPLSIANAPGIFFGGVAFFTSSLF